VNLTIGELCLENFVLKKIGRKILFFGYGCTGVNMIKVTHVWVQWQIL
jgi:hypothetical protein